MVYVYSISDPMDVRKLHGQTLNLARITRSTLPKCEGRFLFPRSSDKIVLVFPFAWRRAHVNH